MTKPKKKYAYSDPVPVELATDREPWERQPEENDKDWTLFCIWRDLAYPDGVEVGAIPGRRSAAACFLAARDLGIWSSKQNITPSDHGPTKWRRRRWQWDRRAEAYDRNIDRVRTEEREHRVRLSERQFGEIARQITEILVSELGKLSKVIEDDLVDDVRMARVSPKDLTNLARTAVQLTRVENDQPDIKVEGKMTYADLVRRAAEAGE